MAWLGGDGFDMYQSTFEVTLNNEQWDPTQSAQFVLRIANNHFRFGGSPTGYLNLGNDSVTPGFLESQNFPGGATPSTIFVNYNMIFSGAAGRVGFQLKDGTSPQMGFYADSGGTYVVTNGEYNGTVIATSPAGAGPGLNLPVHLQVKVVIHNTAGSVEVRRFGSATADWVVTGINTRNGTTNAYCNRIRLRGSVASGMYMDDVYWHDDQGAAPNTFMGDVRCMHYVPNSNDSVQWTPSSGASQVLMIDDPPPTASVGGNDQDSTYNASSAAGDTDRFGLPSLSPVPQLIVCVQTKACFRMDDAGPHQFHLRVTSGGTVVNNPVRNCTNQYQWTQQANPTDPNTGSPWTVANVAAMKVGYVNDL